MANGTDTTISAGLPVELSALDAPAAPKQDFGYQFFVGSEEPKFVEAAEKELARLLEEHGIRWEYEPRTFVLERGEDGIPKVSFTPDFYLPDWNLFVECTVMKQELTTRKNKKVRMLRDLYPEVNVEILYRRDFESFVHEFGFNPDAARPNSLLS